MNKHDYLHVINAFNKFANGENKSIIEQFSVTEIRKALASCALYDSRQIWYQEMQKRILELEQKTKNVERLKESRKEKWLDRGITFILGLASGLFLAYFKNILHL